MKPKKILESDKMTTLRCFDVATPMRDTVPVFNWKSSNPKVLRVIPLADGTAKVIPTGKIGIAHVTARGDGFDRVSSFRIVEPLAVTITIATPKKRRKVSTQGAGRS